jgi:hypothetical protein
MVLCNFVASIAASGAGTMAKSSLAIGRPGGAVNNLRLLFPASQRLDVTNAGKRRNEFPTRA